MLQDGSENEDASQGAEDGAGVIELLEAKWLFYYIEGCRNGHLLSLSLKEIWY